MTINRTLLFVIIANCALVSFAPAANLPHIGYLYPAGAQKGTTITVVAGGQFLRGAKKAYISGDGVQVKVLKYLRPVGNLNKEKRDAIRDAMKKVYEKRLKETSDTDEPVTTNIPDKSTNKKTVSSNKSQKQKTNEMPDHPLLYDLENKSIAELANITSILRIPRQMKQQNRQLAESVILEITVAPDAKGGNRELRIEAATGLTNPMVFQIGTVKEIKELEPNNQKDIPKYLNIYNLQKPKPLELPVVVNGQIMPGDVDRFSFNAKKGQKIVIDTQARALIPYLADAVPGWFQAVVTLYDEKGQEIAYDDDYRFNPDPVLFFEIPKDGQYDIEIRDSIYRGREDFIYRIAIGQLPFITQMFPLGGKANEKTIASISGWNLHSKQLTLNTNAYGRNIRQTLYNDGKYISNYVTYAVDSLPEITEQETNNNIKQAQQVNLPVIINGRIEKSGDVDVFEFKARPGDKMVAEVYARKLNSPMDSLIQITDVTGKVVAVNDDYVIKDKYLFEDTEGIITHHADSYLTFEPEKFGTYYLHLKDSQNHGGAAYAYRLRISKPQPDFALRLVPSSISLRAGAIAPVTVYVLRKDNFDGDISVILKDAPYGFRLDGGKIPAGCDRINMTITAPAKAPSQPVVLHLQGQSHIGNKIIRRPVVAADDTMQAFLYRHLVPAQQLLADVIQTRWTVPPFELADKNTIHLKPGDSAQVKIKTFKQPRLNEIKLALHDAPQGITIDNITAEPHGLTFKIKTDKEKTKSYIGNLIVEAYREVTPKPQNSKPAGKKRTWPIGCLPAIGLQIM